MTLPKPTFVETLIAATNVRSLVWSGDTLIDWAAGGSTYQLDIARARFAIVQPDGIHVVALQP